MRPIIALACGCIAILIALMPSVYFAQGLRGYTIWLLDGVGYTDAVYNAPTYEPSRFARIRAGMSAEDVQAVVGAPLSKSHLTASTVRWSYLDYAAVNASPDMTVFTDAAVVFDASERAVLRVIHRVEIKD